MCAMNYKVTKHMNMGARGFLNIEDIRKTKRKGQLSKPCSYLGMAPQAEARTGESPEAKVCLCLEYVRNSPVASVAGAE